MKYLPLIVLFLFPAVAMGQDPDRNARPCHDDDRYREFDFWIGSWNVVDSQGQPLGTNRVELLLDECLLQENWTGGRGASGKSVNYFDADLGKWKQVWVNSSGGHTEYVGQWSDGAMRFESGGAGPRLRMTFTPLDDGRVRQLIEQSSDGGTTWTVSFDGYYVPAAE